jgi:opacity protein-like surface antigen
MKKLTALILLSASLTAPASAQRLGVSVGYSRMTGPIGNQDSDEGITVHAGAELNPGSLVRFGVEAGLDRLNENRRFFATTCFHPAGGMATCYFNSRDRDTGWSLGTTARVGPKQGQVRPYLLAGLGVLSVRTRSTSTATDSTGAHLTNFEFDGSHSDGALIAPLGAGVLFRPAGSPVGVGIEARMTPLLYGYDGGPWLSWNPSVALTVRFGR